MCALKSVCIHGPFLLHFAMTVDINSNVMKNFVRMDGRTSKSSVKTSLAKTGGLYSENDSSFMKDFFARPNFLRHTPWMVEEKGCTFEPVKNFTPRQRQIRQRGNSPSPEAEFKGRQMGDCPSLNVPPGGTLGRQLMVNVKNELDNDKYIVFKYFY